MPQQLLLLLDGLRRDVCLQRVVGKWHCWPRLVPPEPPESVNTPPVRNIPLEGTSIYKQPFRGLSRSAIILYKQPFWDLSVL